MEIGGLVERLDARERDSGRRRAAGLEVAGVGVAVAGTFTGEAGCAGGRMVAAEGRLVTTEESPNETGGRGLDVPAFLRLFQLRSSQVMWFLGAGCSRAGGIKTAEDMIWDFKQRIYRSEMKLPPSAITDIGEPAVRRKLQAHFDARGGFPAGGSVSEYSAYFEATYHDPRDRRAYLDEQIARGKPSFGHLALALLMSEDLCRIVWTTNFDRTVEDAAAKLFGTTGRLVVADLGGAGKFGRAFVENRIRVRITAGSRKKQGLEVGHGL